MSEPFSLSATFPCTPDRLWSAWVDATGHTQMTGAKATSDPKEGGKFTAWDGYITGTWTALSKPEKIGMSWRTSEFPKRAAHATVEISFSAEDEGTRVTLTQSGSPKGQAARYQKGWEDFYFTPIRAWLAKNP